MIIKKIIKSLFIFFRVNLVTVIGVIVGIFGGYIYWVKVGCPSGSCPITSNPYLSILYGAFLGGLLFSTFTNKKKPA